MKNNKTISVLTIIISLLVLVSIGYLLSNKNTQKTSKDDSIPVVYNNTDFGFTFSLPSNWEGYSVVQSAWQGNPLTPSSAKQTGTKLLIRNPKWTAALPYEDIPVMVFTRAQWDLYVSEKFSVSAAPIQASEIGRNNLYVFALPPRWNFDYSEGYKEAESIVQSNPLKAFNVDTNVSLKLNIDVICKGALAYMSFPDGASADRFVSECKEGKHPEVIERYKSEMNVPDGATI